MFRHALLALSLLCALVGANTTLAQQPATPYRVLLPVVLRPTEISLSAEEQAVLDEINQIRSLRAASTGESCPPLQISPQLQQAAHSHSVDMAERNFFSHVNPDGANPFDRAQAAGYGGSQIAENIAAGYPTPDDVVAGWMASSGHRENILDCSLTQTGIGYVWQTDDQGNVRRANGSSGGPYFSYWTQLFGTP